MNASFFKTLCVAALLCIGGLAIGAPLTHIGQPQYHWSFHNIVADGLGGVKPPTLIFEDAKVGGALVDGVSFAPNSSGLPTLHAEVFSKEGGMSFWAKTFSAPAQAFPVEGDTAADARSAFQRAGRGAVHSTSTRSASRTRRSSMAIASGARSVATAAAADNSAGSATSGKSTGAELRVAEVTSAS